MEAAIDGLAEDGFEGLTMEGVAARAGVGKATVYRRWSSKEALVRGAVEAFVSGIAIPNSGSVETDLLVLMGEAVEVYRGRPGRLMPGLISAMARHPELARVVREDFLRARRSALRTVVRRGIERGELRPDVDVELALDFLGGPLFYRLLVTGGPLDEALARGVVEVMLRGMAEGSSSREA
ncbi:MAG: TetR/AcrR family transcriptional regulator [Gemmatimonadota bacterium]